MNLKIPLSLHIAYSMCISIVMQSLPVQSCAVDPGPMKGVHCAHLIIATDTL